MLRHLAYEFAPLHVFGSRVKKRRGSPQFFIRCRQTYLETHRPFVYTVVAYGSCCSLLVTVSPDHHCQFTVFGHSFQGLCSFLHAIYCCWTLGKGVRVYHTVHTILKAQTPWGTLSIVCTICPGSRCFIIQTTLSISLNGRTTPV